MILTNNATSRVAFLLAFCLAICSARITSATDYDEAVDGDLSGDAMAPTPFALTAGDNLMTATSIGGDVEYFTATIPDGHELSAIFLDSYSNSFGFSFLALQQGTVFTEPVTDTDPANLLGYYLFGNEDLGTDILDDMAMAQDAIGFVPPLPSDDFTFWSQETGPEVTYTYRFVVNVVPEPGCITLGIGILGLALCRTKLKLS